MWLEDDVLSDSKKKDKKEIIKDTPRLNVSKGDNDSYNDPKPRLSKYGLDKTDGTETRNNNH